MNFTTTIRSLMAVAIVTAFAATSALAAPSSSITFTKEVSAFDYCDGASEVTVNTGDEVTFCYQIVQTGPITLTRHTLVDDILGTILDANDIQVMPQTSTTISNGIVITTGVIVTALAGVDSVVNTADWFVETGACCNGTNCDEEEQECFEDADCSGGGYTCTYSGLGACCDPNDLTNCVDDPVRICQSNNDCGGLGKCATSGSQCRSDGDCGETCSNDPNTPCTSDADCSGGTCDLCNKPFTQCNPITTTAIMTDTAKVIVASDNCPNDPNPGQENADSDAYGDACDPCPNDPDNDLDGDGSCGDVEGTGDRDGDSIPNDEDFDPTGYFYDEQTGEILTGGSISVTGPGAPGSITIVSDGSATGFYQFLTSQPGTFTISVTPPPGCLTSLVCPAQPGDIDPAMDIFLGGSEVGNTGFINPFDCGSNPFYYETTLNGGDVFLNNFPFNCEDKPAPAASPWGIGALVPILIGVGGLGLLRRRKDA